MEEFRRDIVESSFPVVIGFDLDGIYGIGESKANEEMLEKRLGRVERVLEGV
jgi:DNA polymerase elongation subunit (family B)